MSGWWAVAFVMLWVLVLALGVLMLAIARQVGTLHLRLGPRGALEMDDEGPPLGDAPEAFEARDLDGRAVSVGGPGRSQLVLFVSPGCPICREVLPGVPVVARGGRLAPVVVADAESGDLDGVYAGTGVGAPVVADPAIPRAYGVPGTPYAVILDAMGVVRAKGTVNNLEQMEGLVDTAERRLSAGDGREEH